jgi:hypothetical protein
MSEFIEEISDADSGIIEYIKEESKGYSTSEYTSDSSSELCASEESDDEDVVGGFGNITFEELFGGSCDPNDTPVPYDAGMDFATGGIVVTGHDSDSGEEKNDSEEGNDSEEEKNDSEEGNDSEEEKNDSEEGNDSEEEKNDSKKKKGKIDVGAYMEEEGNDSDSEKNEEESEFVSYIEENDSEKKEEEESPMIEVEGSMHENNIHGGDGLNTELSKLAELLNGLLNGSF